MRDETLEDESRAFRKRRRRTMTLYWLAAIAFAALFVGSYSWARDIGGVGPALLPVAMLSLWWLFYAKMISALDELDRQIELRSIAVAGAITVWLLVAWSVLHDIGGIAMLPTAAFAPVGAAIYALVRLFWQRLYR